MPRMLAILAFLSLPACEDAADLAGDLDDAVARAAADTGEVEDDVQPGACSPERIPSNNGFIAHCCQDGDKTWHTRTGADLIHRTYSAPCRDAQGGTNCGDDVIDPVTGLVVRCTTGPCGATNRWRLFVSFDEECPANDPICQIHVFVRVPRKGGADSGGLCGWEARGITSCAVGDCDGWQGEDTLFDPEPYDHQPLAASVTAACQYRGCLSGGRPY